MSVDLFPGQQRGTAINHPPTQRWYGLYPAVVSDNQDPDRQGRVKVRLPWSPDGSESYDAWARLATTMAGGKRGTWFVPDIKDEVLVGFGGGNPDHPYVVGALWNGKDEAPQAIDSDNNVKTIVSRKDIRITLDDTSSAVTLTLSTPGGRTITLADAGSTLTLDDGTGSSVELGPSGITMSTSGELSITASSISISAATANVDSASWTYSGVIDCNTLMASTVVSAAYTPGAGNVW